MTHQGPYFEEITRGQDLPLLHRGPLTTAHLMRWSATIENWHKIHYDADFVRAHEKLPGLLINGTLKQQFIIHLLKQFAGRSGWVWKVRFQFRAMNIAGETLSVWARTSRLTRHPDYGLVEFDLGITNEAGLESTPGSAVIALPYRDGAPIPSPFVPPDPGS